MAVLVVLCLCVVPCVGACNRIQFEVNGKCCSMCKPGFYVRRNCTEDTQTSCFPCGESSYTDEPNHYSECLNCSVCDPGLGLRVKTVCRTYSDSVCEVLDGYYCTNRNGGSCSRARRHTPCSPGQFIKLTGTADRDTVCSGCADGTFSNGSLQTCQPHSQCEDGGLTVIKAGSNSSDAECGSKTSPYLIAGVTAGLIVVAVAVVTTAVFRMKYKIFQNTGRASWTADKGPTLRSERSAEIEVEESRTVSSSSKCNLDTCIRRNVR